jgi:hypothetical protein
VDTNDTSILEARARVPGHVVYRDFVNETVVLNLETGTYHGLNRTAGLMLTALEGAVSVREAAAKLAAEMGWDPETAERDMVGLCRTLDESGLIQFDGGDI